jgi:hypothetical protein
LDQVIDTQKNIVAKYAELTQQDPTIAEVMAQNVRAGVGQAIKPMNVGMGGQVVDPVTGRVIHHNPVQKAPEGPSDPEKFKAGMDRLGISVSPEEMKRKFGMAAPERATDGRVQLLEYLKSSGVEMTPQKLEKFAGMSSEQAGAFAQKLQAVNEYRATQGEPPLTAEQATQMAGAMPKAGTVIEVPGEHGTTRVSMGGTGQVQGPPPGEGGKPLPKDAQDGLSGSFQILNNLKTMSEHINKTGLIAGWWNKGKAAVGADEDAIEFERASQFQDVAVQSLIKGIPSNFDSRLYMRLNANITDATPVAKSKIALQEKVTKQLVKDVVGYYKYTGFRVPPGIAAQAKAFGFELDDIPVWDEKSGQTPTAKSEELLRSSVKEAGKGKQDFSKMDGKQLKAVDVDSLSEEDLEKWRAAAFKALGIDPNAGN